MFKIIFWLGLIGGSVFVGGQVIPIYYTNMKVQNVFEGVSENMLDKTDREAISKIKKVFDIQSVDTKSLPPEFFENMVVIHENDKLKINTEYHVRLWLFGAPQSINPDEAFDEKDVEPMDKLRLRARLDFYFSPHAETP